MDSEVVPESKVGVVVNVDGFSERKESKPALERAEDMSDMEQSIVIKTIV
jgi:hypothetical protein